MTKRSNYILTVIGLVSLIAGLVLTLKTEAGGGVLPYVLIGLGCVLFGRGMGNAVSRGALAKHPDVQKQIAIEQGDERNIALARAAKAKAYDVMLYVFGALLIAFGIMRVATAVLLLLVFAYLFVVGYGLYWRNRYAKEM